MLQQQSEFGGYSSTQDTVVGIASLALYAADAYGAQGDVTLTISDDESEGEIIATVLITPDNMDILQRVPIPTTVNNVDVRASGDMGSTVLVSLVQHFNLLELPSEPVLGLTTDYDCEDSVMNKPKKCTVTVCVSRADDGGEGEMALIQFKLFSGFLATGNSLEENMNQVPKIKLVEEVSDKEIAIYLDEVLVST